MKTGNDYGLKAFHKMGNKLINEAQRERVTRMTEQQKTELTVPGTITEDVLAYFQENAETGLEDIGLGGSLPILKVHTSQSTGTELADGSTPELGELFYSGSKTAYKDLTVHILAIKKAMFPEYQNPSMLKSNYLVAGLIADTNEPFVMYIKGMSFNKIWDLQDQIRPFVTNKKRPVPMFAMRFKLFTQLEEPQDKKFKAQYVVKYQLLKSGEFPMIVGTIEQVKQLKEMAEKAKFLLGEIIRKKAGEEEIDESSVTMPEQSTPVEAIEPPTDFVSEVEDISGDIPF
jgi:hypothetical protein